MSSISVQFKDDGRDGKWWPWSPRKQNPKSFFKWLWWPAVRQHSCDSGVVRSKLNNIYIFFFLWRLTCRVEGCRQRNHKWPTEVIVVWLPVLLNLSPSRPDWGERKLLDSAAFYSPPVSQSVLGGRQDSEFLFLVSSSDVALSPLCARNCQRCRLVFLCRVLYICRWSHHCFTWSGSALKEK